MSRPSDKAKLAIVARDQQVSQLALLRAQLELNPHLAAAFQPMIDSAEKAIAMYDSEAVTTTRAAAESLSPEKRAEQVAAYEAAIGTYLTALESAETAFDAASEIILGLWNSNDHIGLPLYTFGSDKAVKIDDKTRRPREEGSTNPRGLNQVVLADIFAGKIAGESITLSKVAENVGINASSWSAGVKSAASLGLIHREKKKGSACFITDAGSGLSAEAWYRAFTSSLKNAVPYEDVRAPDGTSPYVDGKFDSARVIEMLKAAAAESDAADAADSETPVEPTAG